MNRGYYLSVAILVVSGIAVSLILKPHDKEVAYMQMKDNHFKDALKVYEEKYAKGDHSVNVVNPLVALYLDYGEEDKAVAVMESYVAQMPDSIDARRKLGWLYKNAQRPDDYVKNLEAITQIKPMEEDFQELARIYFWKAEYDKQQNALEQLAAHFSLTEQELRNLSYIYASHKEFVEAARLYTKLSPASIAHFTPYTIKFAVSVMLDANMDEMAINLAQTYINSNQQYNALVPVLSVMEQKGRIEQALTLLEPYRGVLKDYPLLLASAAELEIQWGDTTKSFRVLRDKFDSDEMTQVLLDPFMEIALLHKDNALLSQVIETLPLNLLPERRFLSLAEYALEYNKPEWMVMLRKKLDKSFFSAYPAVDIAVSLAQHHSVNRKDVMPYLSSIPPEERVVLARMLVNVKANDVAMAVLQSLQPYVLSYHLDLVEIASFYIQLGQEKQGMQVFASLKNKIPEQDNAVKEKIDLLFAASTGETDKVMAWLNHAETKDFPFVEQIYAMSYLRGYKVMALGAAKKLYALRKVPKTEMYLADAMVLNGEYAKALRHLRALRVKYPDAAFSYVNALLKSVGKTPEAEKELQAFLTSDDWFTHLPMQKKEEIAYNLLEKNHKPQAEQVFFMLANNTAPDSQPVQELMYLWGVKVPDYGKKWLQSRAYRANGQEKLVWLSYFGQADMAKEAIAALEASHEPMTPEKLTLYLDLLYATKQRDKMMQVIETQMAQQQSLQMKQILAHYASAVDKPEVTEALYKQLQKTAPTNAGSLRELGLAAYNQGRYTEAETYLASYLKQGKEDYLVNFTYGELLTRQGKKSEAQGYYEKSQKLTVSLPKDVSIKLTDAMIQYRLGDTEKAFSSFRALVKEAPDNSQIREQFANLLIDSGRYDEAETILHNAQKSF